MSQPVPPSNDSTPGIGELLNQANKAGESSGSTFKVSNSSSSDGFSSFRSWLGDKNFGKFMQGVCQYISNQMKEQQKEAQKAADKLKASEEGKPEPAD